ncbi:polyprenyl synthetase family protein [Arthrobacter sp. CAN_C5]|uniref:polyprenyl synthetase family protein n=1 Tax=Arthrobacter sp. CAN_C5 TaxID=2760706 RepID=UPI001AE578BF|nr:polyprenyl synthetase family protein [Arthrobacter sp. CAN_C5]MBP2215680.1 geranylgeranyl diphosphate synthase type II [Arthrobacter sp. CAN_C5]
MDMETLLVDSRGLEQVESVLSNSFARSKARAATLGPTYHHLWETLENCAAGGKRFRPRMVMTAYDCLAGTDRDNAALVAASFEMLHTALIVHDDVIDRDFVRRGIPNVSGTYRLLAEDAGLAPDDAAHRGLSMGLIAGDLALSSAHRLLDGVRTDPATRERLGELLDDAVFASAAGELLDVDASTSDVASSEETLQMARLKTAVYSFESPLKAGAVLAGADEAIIDSLGDFGRDVGIAYQLADDILGVFGDEKTTGKTTWGDLREGKRTALISYVAQRAEWEQISSLVGSPELSAAGAEKIRGVLRSSGALDHVVSLAGDYAQRAQEHLGAAHIPAELRDGLAHVATAVLARVR